MVNEVSPITPEEFKKANTVNVNRIVTAVNEILGKSKVVDGNVRLYESSILRHAGAPVTDADVCHAICKFQHTGWMIKKEIMVQVGRNEYDTVYEFTVSGP